jgi:hypothetical protein
VPRRELLASLVHDRAPFHDGHPVNLVPITRLVGSLKLVLLNQLVAEGA